MKRSFLPPTAPLLREIAAQVDTFSTDELQVLVDDMFETMRKGGGVGLAAPQIGVGLRVIVFEFLGDEERAPGVLPVPPTVLINPVITQYDGQEEGREGCFSVPGYIGVVVRHTSITYVAQDIDGRTLEGRAAGFHARLIQHEIDHLNGVLYTDIAKDISPYEHEPE